MIGTADHLVRGRTRRSDVGQDPEHGGAAAEVVERLVDVGIDGRGPFLSAQAVAP